MTTATEQYLPLTFASAQERSPRRAHPEYRPKWDKGPCIYDDEFDTVEVIPAWRLYYAGGSNRAHWIIFDAHQQPHIVENISLDGTYEAYGPGYGERLNHVHDAFWLAEQHSGIHTDSKHPAAPAPRQEEVT